MEPFNWTCPFCDKPQIVTESNFWRTAMLAEVGPSKVGDTGVIITAIRCLSKECNETAISVQWKTWIYSNANARWSMGTLLDEWSLRPTSSAIPQPDYIPEAIKQDYYEACAIKDLSPKASTTLIRRCLQGMIRDFCKITRGRLFDEIKELRKQVDAGNAPRGVSPESVDAIDDVRGIGNIGAHMEADVNVIVDVDPDEAELLIKLAEMLLKDWYVEQHNREEQFKQLAKTAAQKKADKKALPKLPGKQ